MLQNHEIYLNLPIGAQIACALTELYNYFSKI